MHCDIPAYRRLNGPFPVLAGMVLWFLLIIMSPVRSFSAVSDDEIRSFQRAIAERPLGERIALWAEKFVGTPYDPDPLGEYVRRNVIVADDRVDCMYLSFRTVELAMSSTPEEAAVIALDKRFVDRGIPEGNGVQNYGNRFQYGEDMIESGKWGREITADIGPVIFIRGSRGRERVGMVTRESLQVLLRKPENAGMGFKNGDFVFFIKSPEKRYEGEIVGHIGIIRREGNDTYLIHASGRKMGEGSVRKVPFSDYIGSMPFAGIRVTRFE